MKLLIVGSRSITSFDLSPYISDETDLIISGGAAGVDTLAERYADEHKISKLILRPKYHLYGKAAPIKRNECMVDLADKILIVWDGISRGAQSTLNYAKKKNKPFILLQTKKEEPQL
ncbi:MAG: DUF2493 domain-containing protein [Ruminococcaceae bacterium]|nr:DUF2493 domain-containing protein [Oscillospiraceae bacterium]